jgi:hypothetical protein
MSQALRQLTALKRWQALQLNGDGINLACIAGNLWRNDNG